MRDSHFPVISPFSNRLLTQTASLRQTPLYVYSLDELRRIISKMKSVFDVPDFQLLFATMANDRLEILQTIQQENVGACVNSPFHLKLTQKAGFQSGVIQFTSTGIPEEEMKNLHQKNITVNLDSIKQIETWCRIIPESKFGARINAASLLNINNENGDRIGMSLNDLKTAKQIAAEHKAKICGLHVYVGTNFQSPEEMMPTLRTFFEISKTIPDLEYVNIGGGIGIDYTHQKSSFNIDWFGKQISQLTKDLCQYHNKTIKLIFEPGRSMIASAGVFITKVTDIKQLNGVNYATVDASIAVFPRPFHHIENLHRVRQVKNDSDLSSEKQSYTIVGRTTFSKDILGRCSLSTDLKVGELLIFDDAGAYCQSMISKFLGQNEPDYVLVN